MARRNNKVSDEHEVEMPQEFTEEPAPLEGPILYRLCTEPGVYLVTEDRRILTKVVIRKGGHAEDVPVRFTSINRAKDVQAITKEDLAILIVPSNFAWGE